MRPRTVMFLAAGLLSASPAFAQESSSTAQPPACMKDGAAVAPDNIQLARDILTTTKAVDRMTMMLDAVMPTMLDMVHKAAPEIPEAAMAEFKTDLREEMMKSVPDLIMVEACVYAQHFTATELQQLEAFYKTPLGQKFLAETPAIAKESMAVGQAWGERSGRAAIERVIAKFKKAGDKT